MVEQQGTPKIIKYLDGTVLYSQDYVDNLEREIEKLNDILDNIGYELEGLIQHKDNKSVISRYNAEVLKNILRKIDKRDVSILGDIK